jgi:hypothetical protein
MPKPVKVLIIWIPTGKTHFHWHLEVRRVIFYPTMKFALMFLAESPNIHVLWMVDHPFKERMRIHQRLDIGKRSDRVYTIRRELSEVPMSSPLRKVLAPSDFMSCSGLVKDKPKGYKSFPESGHTKSALDFMNESISDFHSSKGTGNKYNGFGPATFPSSKIRSMDFAIHSFALLGTKPVVGLVLNQSTWAKSESNLRLMSSVLGTAEQRG